MELVENASPIPNEFSAKDFVELKGCKSQEEFVEFVVELWGEGEGLTLYHDDEICYVYVASQSLLYYSKNKLDSNQQADPPKQDGGNSKVNGSNIFFTSLLILVLFITSMPLQSASAAGYFSGSMREDPTVYPGISSSTFYVSGEKESFGTNLSIVESEDYTATAYSFADPRGIAEQSSVVLNSLPRSANEAYLISILAFSNKFTTAEISKKVGIQATDAQVKSATQLAIWTYASSLQLSYQIDVNSVNDATVRSLATAISTWSTDQVKALPSNKTMSDYLFPFYEPALSTTQAKMTRDEAFATFGPYTITGQSGANYVPSISGGSIVDSSGKSLSKVVSGQQFFVRYPATYAGDQVVNFVGNQYRYSLNYGKDRVWIDKAPEEVEVKFQLNSAVGAKGMIEINTVDAITKQPIPGVSVQISNSSPITTVTTNEVGQVQYSGDVGDYTLDLMVPKGYIPPTPKEVKISFSGDVQVVNILIGWSQAVVNFHAVDAQTLAPAGNSEAFIYDSDNNPVKRIAIKNGVVSGVSLDAGTYNLVQYKTSDSYGINTGTSFEAVAGTITDVSITQVPQVQPTIITIPNAASTDIWVYTFSSEKSTLFQIKGYDSLSLNFPLGEYTVRAQKDDGSVMTPTVSFKPTASSTTKVELEQEVGTETLTFKLADTVKGEAIPSVVLGLFDEAHNLLNYTTADSSGLATFKNVKKLKVYYVNVLAAPPEVSGYSADGNRLLGSTRTITLHLYSLAEVQEKTTSDTIYRVANVSYSGTSYDYPKIEVVAQPVQEDKSKRKKFLGIF